MTEGRCIMKSLMVILLGLFASWHFTELGTDDIFRAYISPIAFCILLMALAVWLVLKAGFGSRTDNSGSHYSGGGFDGDSGGCD